MCDRDVSNSNIFCCYLNSIPEDHDGYRISAGYSTPPNEERRKPTEYTPTLLCPHNECNIAVSSCHARELVGIGSKGATIRLRRSDFEQSVDPIN